MSETLLPYEFHVTVEAGNSNTQNFIEVCQNLGAKAIVLDLGINNGRELTDYMTSSTRQYSTDQAAFTEVDRLADGLSSAGFKVIRRKIETAPWHPLAPQARGEQMPRGSYFESHLAIECKPDQVGSLRSGIGETIDRLPMHLSRNAFKKAKNGRIIIMSTLRDYVTPYIDFAANVEASQIRVGELGFNLAKPPIVEFALYDSNAQQDNAWMAR